MKKLLLVLTSLVACSSEPEAMRRPVTPITVCAKDGPKADVTALTFNAGLGPGMDLMLAYGRIDPVAKAIAAFPADIICIDEAWVDEARDAILARLDLPPDHVVMVDTKGQHENADDRCAPGELNDTIACIRSKCANLPDEDVTRCAQVSCQSQGLLLYLQSRGCFNCVVASAGKTADAIEQTCNGAGASRLYGGRNGVILASRFPIRNAETLDLPSSAANRVGLLATVDAYGTEIEVACTHLSGQLDFVTPTDTRFPDWTDEMKAQLDLIANRLAARAGNKPQLLMGDLNAGPSYAGDMKPVAAPVWDEIDKLGLTSPAVNAQPHICSRCKGNRLSSTENLLLIDHVLQRGDEKLAPLCAATVFDEPVLIRNSSGAEQTVSLSDHYGISVQFSLH